MNVVRLALAAVFLMTTQVASAADENSYFPKVERIKFHLAKGGGGGIALERIKPFLLAGDVSGLRFSIANARKDLGYYGEMATQAHAAHALADAVTATLELGLKAKPDGLMPELAALLAK